MMTLVSEGRWHLHQVRPHPKSDASAVALCPEWPYVDTPIGGLPSVAIRSHLWQAAQVVEITLALRKVHSDRMFVAVMQARRESDQCLALCTMRGPSSCMTPPSASVPSLSSRSTEPPMKPPSAANTRHQARPQATKERGRISGCMSGEARTAASQYQRANSLFPFTRRYIEVMQVLNHSDSCKAAALGLAKKLSANPSIEGTSYGLRPPAAPHVKR